MIETHDQSMLELTHAVGAALGLRGWRLVTAESCTGGLIASTLTALSGSSDWFEGAFVVYRPSAKRRFLNVEASVLTRNSLVSEPVARAMAEGALAASNANVSVSTTGIAGPTGGEPSIPVGTVWFAWCTEAQGFIHAESQRFAGEREAIRHEAVRHALQGVLKVLS